MNLLEQKRNELTDLDFQIRLASWKIDVAEFLVSTMHANEVDAWRAVEYLEFKDEVSKLIKRLFSQGITEKERLKLISKLNMKPRG